MTMIEKEYYGNIKRNGIKLAIKLLGELLNPLPMATLLHRKRLKTFFANVVTNLKIPPYRDRGFDEILF